MPAWVDLSHVVEHGLVTYEGLPAPVVCDFLSRKDSRGRYAPGVEFQIGRIDMVANTGTYVDAPFHRYDHGKDLSQLPLSSLAGLEAVKVTARGKPSVDAAALRGLHLHGKALLIETGWADRWNTPAYFKGHPFLTRDAAEFLATSGVKLVGIDSYNMDDTADLTRPAHSILLGADIPLCEHLCNLQSVPARDFTFSAVPVKIRGMGTFPVRAFAGV